jgi:hypothetical protein
MKFTALLDIVLALRILWNPNGDDRNVRLLGCFVIQGSGSHQRTEAISQDKGENRIDEIRGENTILFWIGNSLRHILSLVS